MPLPIGPILGIAARAAVSKITQRGAMAAAGRTVSTSQLGSRGLVSRLGQSAGRGAMLRTAFMASGASSGGSGSSGGYSPQPIDTTPQPKQGLDTYGDGIY